jgi:putative hydroxymethylpyrimidine transport system substrate-binding protein
VRVICLLLVAAALLAGCGSDDEAVTLALDFQPNAAHAGIYAAEGEDLRIVVPSSSTDSLKLLESGRADMAVVDIHDLGLARERGADVVGVGALLQRPLAAVIAAPGVRRPRDLEGKRVGVTGLPSDDAVLRAVVEGDGGVYSRVRRTTIGFSAVPSLIAGRVDAVVAFWNAEGVALRQRGVHTREFRVGDHGAPRYPELVLAVKPDRVDDVQDALDAIAAGTRAALADPDATVDRLVEASGTDTELVRAQLDAIAPALRPPIRLDRAALAAWARFDARFGILDHPPDVERAFPPSP